VVNFWVWASFSVSGFHGEAWKPIRSKQRRRRGCMDRFPFGVKEKELQMSVNKNNANVNKWKKSACL
jgi:hypothetical protein